MIELSVFSRNAMLNGTGIKEQFDTGVIELYSGPQPINANAAVQGTLLGTITKNAGAFTPGNATNGLTFDAPVSGVLSKAAAETWSMLAVAAGTIGWGRFKGNAVDAGAGADTTHYRLDFSVGISGADLNLANINVVVGTPITINTFALTMPQE